MSCRTKRPDLDSNLDSDSGTNTDQYKDDDNDNSDFDSTASDLFTSPTPYSSVNNTLAHTLRELKVSLKSFHTSARKIPLQWAKLCETFPDNDSNSFQNYVLESLDENDLKHIIERCEQSHYNELITDKRKRACISKLIEKNCLGLDWWALYFWFGKEIVQSRDALQILIGLGKAINKCRKELKAQEEPTILGQEELTVLDFTYQNVYANLVIAKAERRRRRGVSNNAHAFAVDDITRMGRKWNSSIQGLLANLESIPSPEIARGNSMHNKLQHNHSLHDDDEDDDGVFHLSHEDHAIEELDGSLPFQISEHGDTQKIMDEEGCVGVHRWEESGAEFESGYEEFRGMVNNHEDDGGLSANDGNFSDEEEISFQLLAEPTADVSGTPSTPDARHILNTPEIPQLPSIITLPPNRDGQQILPTPERMSSAEKQLSEGELKRNAAVTHQCLKNNIQSANKWTDYTLHSVLESFKYPDDTRLLYPLAFSSKNFRIKEFYKYEKIFVPIHHPGRYPHWTLAVVRPQENSFKHYDSIRSTKRSTECSDLLLAWIQRQMTFNEGDMGGVTSRSKVRVGAKTLNGGNMRSHPSGTHPECAQQSDSSSCGPFVATFVYRMLNFDNRFIDKILTNPVNVELMRNLFIGGLDSNQVTSGIASTRNDEAAKVCNITDASTDPDFIQPPPLAQATSPEMTSSLTLNRVPSISDITTPSLIDSTPSTISDDEPVSPDALFTSITNTKHLLDKFREQERTKRKMLDVEREENIVKRRRVEEESKNLMERLRVAKVEDEAIELEKESIKETLEDFKAWERLMPKNIRPYGGLQEISSQINAKANGVEAKKRYKDAEVEKITHDLNEEIVKGRELVVNLKEIERSLEKQVEIEEMVEKYLGTLVVLKKD
ncbi:hypothetical protein BELL_0733g00050 [Botrytis elliptica]|uniref:Ubiquitin-like protease family profile domain-containing protein n=1 Tax=Botrytis elliptica TaxID=278938 RepID=A0A4Z1JN10_9HELO|nr:hypothetical protein BELL_0733g00050 [Botrytis elliptica]